MGPALTRLPVDAWSALQRNQLRRMRRLSSLLSLPPARQTYLRRLCAATRILRLLSPHLVPSVYRRCRRRSHLQSPKSFRARQTSRPHPSPRASRALLSEAGWMGRKRSSTCRKPRCSGPILRSFVCSCAQKLKQGCHLDPVRDGSFD